MVVGFIRRVPVLGYLLNLPGISSVSVRYFVQNLKLVLFFYSIVIAIVEMQQK